MNALFRRRACVGLLLLAACKAQPFVLDPGTALDASEAVPLPPADAGASDGAMPAADGGKPCQPSPERCNGQDDDCDGRLDEDFDTQSDPANCGGCGRVCLRPFSTGTCQSGVCRFACEPNRYDRDHAAANGCEQLCFSVPDGQERCNQVDDDCDGKIDESFDLRSDPQHCGTCDHVCPGAHGAGPTCVKGECGIASCKSGYAELPGHDGCAYRCPVSPTQVETCNGLDDDCDGEVDEDVFGAADPCTDPGFETQADTGACTFGVKRCSGQAYCDGYHGPSPERCNGLDDDCDGTTDEDIGTEICNGADDDCDGNMDEGLTCTQCAGGSELCNGLDDDCDNGTDELWPALGTACNNGQRYTCKRTGVVECAPDGMSARCSAETIVPAPETCNGKDDDCDGIADEDTPAHPIGAPVGDACGGGSTCSAGFFVCDHGALRCDTSHAAAELCNGKDDDCNGLIDDGVTTEVGLPCDGPASGASTGADQGECAPGKTACLNGAIQCTSYVGPADEVCNGKDDDCDGASDEHAFCPNAGGVCLHAQCVVPCGKGGCPFAYYCAQLPQGGYCVPDPCVTVSCDSDEVCEHGSGKCAKICAEAVCEPGETCVAGVCVDCFTAPCARGQLCVANARGVGVCQADRCATKSCAARSEACIDGECIALECDPSCAADESCVLGRCVADRCEDLRCAAGMLCDPKRGACVNDRCDGVACSQGMVCDREKGRCVPDRCVTTVCPSGSNCVVRFDGSPYCAHPTRAALSEAGWRNQDSPVAQGGGGFSCSLAGPGAAPALLSARWLGMACVLWLILSLRLRSRRKRKSVRVPGCDAPCC